MKTTLSNDLTTRITEAIDADRDRLVEFIRLLVRTRSLPGEERAVQEIIGAELKNMNFEINKVPILPEKLVGHPAYSDDGFDYSHRFNIVGRWQGTNQARSAEGGSLILNGHVDVVSPGSEILWSDSPWSGRLHNGRIYGRGSADMKSGVAAAVFACKALQAIGFKPAHDVIIQSVVGEETGGCGTLTNILKGYTADAAIITEPTCLMLLPVQSGALSFRLRITGKSIHACMKNKGVSAVEKFFVIFQALEEFDRRRHRNYSNALYEDPANIAPINIGTVHSGDWPSTVPDMLTAEGRFGIFPDEKVDTARRDFEEAVMQAACKDEWLKHHPPVVQWFEGQFESGSTDRQDPLIRALCAVHKTVLKQEPQIAGATYGSDLRLFTNYGKIPTVLYGPGDVKEAHTANESIAVAEVLDAVKVLAGMISHWCGSAT